MDTRAIRCFLQVYEKRSIHQAAKVLFLTPQGVSRIIGVLGRGAPGPAVCPYSQRGGAYGRGIISMNTAVPSPPSCSGSSWGSRN